MEIQADIITLILSIWFLLTLLISGLIVYYQMVRTKAHILEKEKQLATFKASVEAEEKQKEKIAVNLHDEILPLLTALKQNILQHNIDLTNDVLVAQEFSKDVNLIDSSIKGIRNVALDLMPTILQRFGLIKALEENVRQLNNQSVIVEFENKLRGTDTLLLSKNQEIIIYRICIELLSNLQKHAHYKYLGVTFHLEQRSLSILFRHDGKGVTNQQIDAFTETTSGMGLNLLRTRLLILGATINYSVEQNVSTIHIIIPHSL